MANALYPSFKEALLKREIDLRSMPVKVLCVDTADYSYSAAHNFLNDVAVAARVATSPELSGKTVTGGVFDADDVVIPSVSGDQFEALILFIDHAASPEAEDPLIAYLDSGYSNLPCTPDSGDLTIVWPGDANKIFAL